MKMDKQIIRAALFCSVVLIASMIGSADTGSVHRPIRRAVSDSSSQDDMGVTRTCNGNTPCEWAVYFPFSRRVDYVMKNTCICAVDKQCVRTDDDLSVSAYVHRCRSPPEPTQIS